MANTYTFSTVSEYNNLTDHETLHPLVRACLNFCQEINNASFMIGKFVFVLNKDAKA